MCHWLKKLILFVISRLHSNQAFLFFHSYLTKLLKSSEKPLFFNQKYWGIQKLVVPQNIVRLTNWKNFRVMFSSMESFTDWSHWITRMRVQRRLLRLIGYKRQQNVEANDPSLSTYASNNHAGHSYSLEFLAPPDAGLYWCMSKLVSFQVTVVCNH